MKTELINWSRDLRTELMDLCNSVDRSYLSDRIPSPYTEADADWWLGMVSEHDGVDGLFRAIVLDGKIVGSISVECRPDVYHRDCEIGYMLLTEYWSQGIMTEAVRLMCEEAFEKLDIARITGIVYTENEASWRVLEKNGFVREGLQRKTACKKGKMHDVFLYGKLREDRTAISVDLMRRSDAYTIEHYVPSKELMYRAAYGVYLAYNSRRGEGAVSNGMHERNLMPDGWQGKQIAILAGGGNNGGDGYALAWILKEAGIDSTVIRVSDKLSEDGRYYCGKAEACGVTMRDFAKPEAGEADKRETPGNADLSGYDVIVDCILGTGFKGDVRGNAADAIKAINESGAYVISVDINSGMNGDTGEAVLAVKSDLTVSVGYYKQGLFRGDADKYIKEMTNVDIGIILLKE